jgi:hypothetical protein
MIRRMRVVLIATAAILLAIPLLPGPGVFIIMAALADVHDAFHPPQASRPPAGFPPADAPGADTAPLKRLTHHELANGRRVA